MAQHLREHRFALSFSGQGYPWLPTLREAIAAGAGSTLGRHLKEAAELIAPVADELAAYTVHGFTPLEWAAAREGEEPSAALLAESAVSTPGIVTAQVAVLESLRAQGLEPREAVAAIGHSQGALATYVAAGRATAAEAIALGQLIGAAITATARLRGLVRTAQGSPMVAVNGISREELEATGMHIGLRNGRERFVMVGPAAQLRAAQEKLEARAARSAQQAEKKQRGGRAFAPSFVPLDVQCAYHHPAMHEAVDMVERWGAQAGIDAELVAEAARAVLTDTVDWPAAVAGAIDAGAEWILECGPAAGVEPLTRRAAEGRGVGTLVVSGNEGQAQLFDAGRAPTRPQPWSAWRPRVRGERLVSALTKATGYSPVMLPGMTPSTVDPAIVAAAANAGHWAELAGGGQYTDEQLAANLDKLQRLLRPGVNAQFNAMYLSASQWRRQIVGQRAVPKARAQGAPISGIVVSAGIPPLEEAVELVESLHADNFPWVAFKPGTVQQIDQVLRIADACADQGIEAPLMLQIEGGHAGGHHSWEDLEELLVATYGRIRQRSNVILAVGGGIGTPERGAEFLLGTWARAYDMPDAPVDGIMIGTAAMATRESTASESVKQALVAAQPATENGGWAPAGGATGLIASGRSQLGADIHEIDNSFARAGRLLDEVAGDAEAVAARREEIIEAISHTCKPYFGDLESMSYVEWLERYLELSYRGAWADHSWALRFQQMVERTEARLSPVDHGEVELRVEVDDAAPAAALSALREAYGKACDNALHPADAAWFLLLLRQKGKPANFVPVIDAEVRRVWRQDTLWQAHDERYDADEVCIIPGTTAVAGITRANEPVAELLARFEAAAAQALDEAPDAAVEEKEPTPTELIAAAPTVNWAGREQPNPLHRLRPEHGASLSEEDGAFWLSVPLALSQDAAPSVGEAPTLRIRITPPSIPGASPVISTEDAQAAMRELARVAAGGELPQVTDSVAQWETTLPAADRAAYANVTAGYVDSGELGSTGSAALVVPDVLVGKAWPAVFAVIADTPAVEGLLNLVHLEHSLVLHASELPAEEDTLRITASAGRIADTTVGRVVEVDVEMWASSSTASPIATLHERFAIQRRAGAEALDVRPAPASAKDTARSFRHSLRARAPRSMRPFAVVSGDRNPIHVSDAAARLAGLEQGVIVHGMWTSALAQLAAGFDGARVREWSTSMLAPVLPGAEVDFRVERTGIDTRAGYGEIRSVTATCQGTPVLEARATMSAPRTFYGFPGQGIQSQGMGMEAFASSPAARRVWERADRHTREHLGFSILEIVRTNPRSVTVNGECFSHPEGALFLTQFTQVAMATLGCAQIAEMKEAGVLENDAFFAGHSVGEYNALAAYAEVLSLEAVVEIVYVRGLTMHRLVERDAQGVSNYGLAALRPNKMGMGSHEVFEYVAGMAERTGEFLEIVNYNIDGVQYAVAGTRAGLKALAADAERRAPGKRAFIRIPGIDVPFHSTHLLGGVPAFREHLDSLIPADVDLHLLVDRYVPNLVARPFSLERDFVEAMAQVVDSQPIAEILADYPAAAADPTSLGRTLLIELLAWQFASPVRWIETQDLLLSPQGSTAGAGTEGLGVERFVEVGVGSSPTLANMLGQTLRLPQYAGHPIEVLNAERDRPQVFAEDAVAAPVADTAREDTAEDIAEAEPAAEPLAPQQAAPAPASASGAVPAEAAAAAAPADQPFRAQLATEMLVCLWTKVRPDQIGATDTIEALVEGVSSRRNQLLLDLGVEFGLGAIDGAAEAPLPQLQEKVASLAKGYQAFGPVLGEHVAETLRRLTGPAGKKPAYVAERVTETWGLGRGWADRVTAELVLGVREGSSLRGGELATLGAAGTSVSPSSAAELDALIDAGVDSAAARAGVSITKPTAAAAGSGAVVDSAALEAYAERIESSLAETARTLLAQLGREEAAEQAAAEPDTLADLVAAELGADWATQVAPRFDADKAVLLDDHWATAREDIARVAAGQCAAEEIDVVGAGEAAAQIADFYGLPELARQARSEQREGRALAHAGQLAVVTGGSPRSIAAAIIGQLLREGAQVVATTSRLDHERLEFYKQLYRSHAAGSAQLWVVPANLSSFADVDSLVEWIGSEQTATVGGKSTVLKPAMVPDMLFPFAAPRVAGTLAEAGASAESQMRLLLWSVEKLIAGLSTLGADTSVGHRLHVVLPGSPNRGRFGGDGAYGESKAALDALVTRWKAEPVWGQRTSLVHAHIGWVRGTGLMGGNDPMVELVEARGVRTFSTEEIAQQLLREGASVSAREHSAAAPLTLDLTGGLAEAELNLPELAREAARRAEQAASGEDAGASPSASASEPSMHAPRTVAALPNALAPLRWTTPDFSGCAQALEEMVVIVGAGELGPVGSSRTRYEVEVGGDLSAAGVLELAWSRGLIEWDATAAAWVSAEGVELDEAEVYERFHDEVLAELGVRRYHDDFGPHMPMVDNLAPELTTIYLEKPLTFTVADEETARTFAAEVEGTRVSFDGEEWQVTRPAGSPVRVPRRVAMTRFVGGQIPEGFDPAVYGIPADMIDNLDRVALWNIVCTVDAFLSAGFSPAELLASVHPARVSSTQGTGMGGMASLRSLYVDKLLAQSRPNDILQEALPNVIAAHVMQSYVGGYGQMVHPVAACATAAVSVEEGVDKLRLGKADFVVAGGIDDLSIEGITGFGDMAATADSAEMEAKGIEHRFFSRANDRRRGGFIESEGGGTILLTRGDLAADLGLPVLGVVGYAESFADGAHTSIPAPGMGALSAARGGQDSRLARALSELSVSPDEIAVVSKHDTSTNANDPNESDLHERLAAALGRAEGNPLFVISQKTLTGHAKGGAAAFQLVGLTQVLREGILPPNRSLDCVDPVLRRHGHLVWLREKLDLAADGRAPKAGLVTSLGFGHVSALIAVVHPGAFLAALAAERGQEAAEAWEAAARARELAGLRRIEAAMRGGAALYERPVDRNLGGTGDAVKEREAAVLLDASARLRGGVLCVGEELSGEKS
ncbi:type I polyketide synthase [Corynebacterium sp.]|uniref:type I polyketide synthase n=1 Tax=Corynebacterium sp. TaxID=1720 RepID=UPI0026DBDAB1|nr:type I polyketide synthase [Corynebacterium sp.]MDO5032928.1 DUF1729 domain-containing protein [Corynebacterium sp.]